MSIANLGYKEVLNRFDGYLDYLEEIKKIEDKMEWEKAKRKDTQKAYQKYLLKYPNGIYNFEAKQKIDELIAIAREKEIERRRQEEIKRKKDEETWRLVCKSDTKEDYENYLKYYPNGIYSDEAQSLVQLLSMPMHLNKYPNKKRYKILGLDGWGIVDRNKNYIIQPLYDLIEKLDDTYYLASKYKNNKYYSGLYNVDGKVIVKLGEWDLRFNNKKTYTTNIKIEPNDKEYRVASYSRNSIEGFNLTIFHPDLMSKFNHQNVIEIYDIKNDTFGFISKDGELLLEPIYRHIYLLKNGIGIICTKEHKYGLIDKNYRIIREPEFYYIDSSFWENGFSSIVKYGNNKEGLINIYGEVILDIDYDFIETTGIGFFIIWKDNKCGLVNHKGKFVISLGYDYITYSKESKIVLLKNNNKLGFAININGKVSIIEPELDWWINGEDMLGKIKYFASYFKKPWTIKYIRKNGKYGIIDNKLDYILPPIYDKLYSGKEETSYGKYGDSLDVPMRELYSIDIVKYHNKYGLFKVHKGIVLRPSYDFIYKLDYHSNEDYYIISNEGKDGICNRNGKIILDIKYKLYRENYELVYNIKNGNFTDLNEVVFMVKKDNKFGLFHVLYEQFILKPIYNKFDYYTPLTSDDYNDDIIIKIGNKKGLINSSGTWLKPLSIWNNFKTI